MEWLLNGSRGERPPVASGFGPGAWTLGLAFEAGGRRGRATARERRAAGAIATKPPRARTGTAGTSRDSFMTRAA
ncbi:hypothetical protein E2R23_18055 [Burkholderia pseudomallei]|nr:hypothetical protein [Burkholderia pseudomallei]NRD87398.1 hypothetical protein [Burkholderia pseudomallei]NRE46566.1 hypothetical protein [Burkholderia pseudomallei]QBI48442.1 hypothetical protein EXY72_18070 [Burkholderia pseudomallei]QBL79695.1 hypothetical protein EYA82_17820 [Burkholderia pseudomallei]